MTDANYLRKMLQERGKLTVLGDGVKAKRNIRSEGRILIVGDVEAGASIVSEKQVFVLGNVSDSATIAAEGTIFITGKSRGNLRTVNDDEDEGVTIRITMGDDDDEDSSHDKVTVLGYDEPQSEAAVYEVMEWVGTKFPLTKERSLARKFGLAAGAAAGATVLAVGFSGLKHLGLDVGADLSMVFNAMCDNPFSTLVGAWLGLHFADKGRPKLEPLALKNQAVPMPLLPAPTKKTLALPAPEKKDPPKPAPLI